MEEKQRSGFTKTGFSKAGFAACSHFEECLLGKLSCYYEEIDPEVEKYCFCYQRNHSDRKVNQETPSINHLSVQKGEETVSNNEMEQLSLF